MHLKDNLRLVKVTFRNGRGVRGFLSFKGLMGGSVTEFMIIHTHSLRNTTNVKEILEEF